MTGEPRIGSLVLTVGAALALVVLLFGAYAVGAVR